MYSIGINSDPQWSYKAISFITRGLIKRWQLDIAGLYVIPVVKWDQVEIMGPNYRCASDPGVYMYHYT